MEVDLECLVIYVLCVPTLPFEVCRPADVSSFSFHSLSLFLFFLTSHPLLSSSPFNPPSSSPLSLSLSLPRLFVEKLPKQYPDYNKPEYKQDRAKIKKLVKEAFPRAEQLKKQLLNRFEADKQALEAKLAEEVS